MLNMVNKSQQCLQCEYKATTKSKLQTHIKPVHEGQKFPCPHCEYKATDKGNLQKHIKVHEGHMFPCPQCNNKFTQRNSLQKQDVWDNDSSNIFLGKVKNISLV